MFVIWIVYGVKPAFAKGVSLKFPAETCASFDPTVIGIFDPSQFLSAASWSPHPHIRRRS